MPAICNYGVRVILSSKTISTILLQYLRKSGQYINCDKMWLHLAQLERHAVATILHTHNGQRIGLTVYPSLQRKLVFSYTTITLQLIASMVKLKDQQQPKQWL